MSDPSPPLAPDLALVDGHAPVPSPGMAADAIAAPSAPAPAAEREILSIFAAAPGAPQTPVEPADPSDTFLEMAHRSDRLALALVGRLGAPPQVRLTLPAAMAADGRGVTWATLWQQLMHRLHVGDRHWPPATTVVLVAGDRDLEPRQLAAIAEVLQEVQLTLAEVLTNRPTLARLAIDQGYRATYRPNLPSAPSPKASGNPSGDRGETDKTDETNNTGKTGKTDAIDEPNGPQPNPEDILTVNNTIRSGVEIRYPGTIVIIGDVNPGGSVVAAGDIIIWGRLRGVAHAGSQGNGQATIAALQLEATQLRIASRAARVPPAAGDLMNPEIAYICDRGIRISPLRDYPRSRGPATVR